jgi:protein transport protein SEC24
MLITGRALLSHLFSCFFRHNRCKIPLSAVLQPLNDATGCNVGWTEFPTGAPIRCTGCKGYINASVKWRDSGREWICNLCGLPNVVNRCVFSSKVYCFFFKFDEYDI